MDRQAGFPVLVDVLAHFEHITFDFIVRRRLVFNALKGDRAVSKEAGATVDLSHRNTLEFEE